jgi:hypothetical protein
MAPYYTVSKGYCIQESKRSASPWKVHEHFVTGSASQRIFGTVQPAFVTGSASQRIFGTVQPAKKAVLVYKLSPT